MSIAKALTASLAIFEVSTALGFQPNCSLPHNGTTFVSAPNVRGTLSIVWNCVSIIFLCSWSILHLNVPAAQARPSGFIQTVWQATRGLRKKLKWMLFVVFVPEFLVGKSISDWRAAQGAFGFMQRFAQGDGVEWEMIHCYFCDMGGFAVDFSEVIRASGTGSTTLEELVRGVRATHPGMSTNLAITLSRMERRLWILNNCQMAFARRFGIIKALPDVPAAQLKQLSNSDPLIKFLAVIQVSWLVLQLIVRKSRSFSISQLEIATLAFSVTSFVTYIFCWNKPQGIEVVTKIAAARFPEAREIYHLSGRGQGYLWTGRRSHSRDMDFIPIPNDATQPTEYYSPITDPIPRITDIFTPTLPSAMPLGAALSGVVFGAIHCLAWHFRFPTLTDRFLWRLCSVMMTSLPFASIPLVFLWRVQNAGRTSEIGYWRRKATVSGIIFAVLPYCVARLVILVEIFRGLAFLPPDAFKETWSGAFPHWG